MKKKLESLKVSVFDNAQIKGGGWLDPWKSYTGNFKRSLAYTVGENGVYQKVGDFQYTDDNGIIKVVGGNVPI